MGDAVSWLFPLAGLVLFEVFADPVASVVVACLKFGYADFRTAIWLRGDPNPVRCSCLPYCYLARGSYVVALTALLITLAIGVCETLFKQVPNANIDSFIAGMTIWLGGVFLGTFTGGLAMRRIGKAKLSVWMDSTIHSARREKRRHSVCTGSRNQLGVTGIPVLPLSPVFGGEAG